LFSGVGLADYNDMPFLILYSTFMVNNSIFVHYQLSKGTGISASELRECFFQVAVLRDIEEALGSPLDSGPQVPAPKPLIIVISGPSGVGKDAVVKVWYLFFHLPLYWLVHLLSNLLVY
jgi:hypothetical protein